MAAHKATTPASRSGASFTPINQLAGNVANVVDPALQAFFPNKDFSASIVTVRHDVWPNRAPAQSKDKPDSDSGNQSQGQQNISNHNVEANQVSSGAHVQGPVSQQAEISHDNRNSRIPSMPNTEPGQAVVSQRENFDLQELDLVPTAGASKESACNASAEDVRTFNSRFTIKKRPRAVPNPRSVKRNASTVVLPAGHASSTIGIEAQPSKLLKRGMKREAESTHSPSADPSSNDGIPRKMSSRLAAKAQPSNVYRQDPLAADPDELSDVAGDDFKPPSSRKIASGLAPVKRVWKRSEQPLEKSAALKS